MRSLFRTHTTPVRLRRGIKRRGSAVFETIITLPLLIAGLFSIVEFSMLVNRQQHLVEACRNGALVASRLEPKVLESTAHGEAPRDVVQAVTGRLADAHIDAVEIDFSYDRAAQAAVAKTQKELGCSGDVSELGRCVRVSISVPATELSPNLLEVFGFDISRRMYSAAAVFPYEK